MRDRGYVVRDADGRPVRMLGVISDVTRQVAGGPVAPDAATRAIGRLTGVSPMTSTTLLTVILGNAEVLASDGDDERRTLAK